MTNFGPVLFPLPSRQMNEMQDIVECQGRDDPAALDSF